MNQRTNANNVGFMWCYIIFVLFSSILFAISIYFKGAHNITILLFSISPALIAFIFIMFDRSISLKSFGWQIHITSFTSVFVSIMGIVGVLLVIAFLLGHTEIHEKSLYKLFRFETLIAILLGIVVNTGEEAGWRGYLLQKSNRHYHYWKTTIILTFVWWAWHFPVMAALQLSQHHHILWDIQLKQLFIMFPLTIIFNHWYFKYKSVILIGFCHQLINFSNKWFLGLEHSYKNPVFFKNKDYVGVYSLENGWLGLLVISLLAIYILLYKVNKKSLVSKLD